MMMMVIKMMVMVVIGIVMMMRLIKIVMKTCRRSKKAAPREGGRASMVSESGSHLSISLFVFLDALASLESMLAVSNTSYFLVSE